MKKVTMALILALVLQILSGCQRCSLHEDVEKNKKSQKDSHKK